MANLTANQKSFVEMMTRSDEHAARGFDLLLKRQGFIDFFDALNASGLFLPEKNPAPVKADDQGRYRIPYWKALDYLVGCAQIAGEQTDTELAAKILKIVRAASAESSSGADRQNFHTLRQFAQILGKLPPGAVTEADVDLVQSWLSTPFDRAMVAHVVSDVTLPNFLRSGDPLDSKKALKLFGYCTAVQWPSDDTANVGEPVPVVDEYWVRELVRKHAIEIGRKCRADAAALTSARVAEIFDKSGLADASYVFRPAVEDDGQNRFRRDAENISVQACRDVFVGWIQVEPTEAKKCVGDLLAHNSQILRRIGIYLTGEFWELLQHLYLPVVAPGLFDSGHLHELYGLLKRRFEEFDEEQKAGTISALREIQLPDGKDDPGQLGRLQLRWLSAIANSAYDGVPSWLAELTAKHGQPPKHPDYLAYTESRWGPGPSPYSAIELIAFLAQGTLIQKLAAFRPTSSWNGPSLDGLVDQLEQAVTTAPLEFAASLPAFLGSSLTYQHAVLSAYWKLWREPDPNRPFREWDTVWPRLFDFAEALFKTEDFWEQHVEDGGLREVTPMWIASVVASLLQAGTRDDSHAYPSFLLSRGWLLIRTLLDHADAADQPGDDPMFQAINSARGKALEAALSHCLRVCRLADRESKSHDVAWSALQPLFDSEVARCESGNFEFSTLAGAYSSNLEYVSYAWFESNVENLFPVKRSANLTCAIEGLAYAAPSRRIYRLLRDKGILDVAVRLDLKGRHGYEKLMERLALAYIWDEESLDSSRFRFLFESSAPGAIEKINVWLASIGGDDLRPEQVKRVVQYWRHCLDWAAKQTPPPTKVLSSLGGLVSFLPDAAGENEELLLRVAPFIDEHHGAYEFVGELLRLVDGHPNEVCNVLKVFVDTHGLTYDYEDRLQQLVEKLAMSGLRTEAIDLCNRLRFLPGLFRLFERLTAGPTGAT